MDSLKSIGLVIAGAGANEMRVDFSHGLIAVAVGAALVIIVAVLQKYNFPIARPPISS